MRNLILFLATLLFLSQCKTEKITKINEPSAIKLLKEFSERRLYLNMNNGSSERNKVIMNEILQEKNIDPHSFYQYLKNQRSSIYKNLFGSK